MRAFAIALLLVLAALQYRLWLSDDGIRSVVTLRASVKAQAAENAALTRRNDQLAAEVKDLKEGLGAVEERARTDLGMIGKNESFFQVVEGEPHAAAPPASAAAPLPIQRTSR
jgi:cell division protein FtsB